MKKKFSFILSLFLFSLVFCFIPHKVNAQVLSCTIPHQVFSYSTNNNIPADLRPGDDVIVDVSTDIGVMNESNITASDIMFCLNQDLANYCAGSTSGSFHQTAQGFQASFKADSVNNGNFRAILRGNRNGGNTEDLCFDWDALKVTNLDSDTSKVSPECSYSISPSVVKITDKEVSVSYDAVQIKDSDQYQIVVVKGTDIGGGFSGPLGKSDKFEAGSGNQTLKVSLDPKDSFTVYLSRTNFAGPECIHNYLYNAQTGQIDTGSGSGDDSSGSDTMPFELCSQAGSPNFGEEGHDEYEECLTCFNDQKGIWTGVGCIPYNDQTDTVRAFIVLGLGIAGAVVIMMSLAAGFLLSTSQGDPKRVDEAKSLITSAVSGALFIIFSVTILRFIGVNILQLPAFG